jgi:hypothetical protein
MHNRHSKELGVETHAVEDPEKTLNDVATAGTHVPLEAMGTANDQHDMRVMGKLQELRVRFRMKSGCMILIKIAKLPLHVCSRNRLYIDEHLGDRSRLDCLCSHVWRHGWNHLDICYCLCGVLVYVCFFG